MSTRNDEWLFRELQKIDAPAGGLSGSSLASIANWARAARAKSPVALIGAGMSLNAVPTPRWIEIEPGRATAPQAVMWKDLSQRFRKALEHDGEKDEADPLWLAELYEQRFGREALIDVIRDSVPDHLLSPGDAHRALFDVPWHTILTANYDTLIQRAFRELSLPYQLTESVTDNDLVRSRSNSSSRELIHIHGIISRPETVIITLEDYRTYAAKHPGVLVKLRQLFLQHPVLLIGISATDPNFVQWSGWLSDLVGAFRNPWLSLAVNATPGTARASFWNGALEFVPVTPGQIPDILRLLGSYLSPVGEKERLIDLLEDLGLATTIPGLIGQVATALASLGGLYPTDSQAKSRHLIITESVRRAFIVKLGKPVGETEYQKAVVPTRLEPGPMAGVFEVMFRRIQPIRDVFGDNLPGFVALVSESLGPEFSLGPTLTLRVPLEIEAFASATPPTITRKAKLGVLEYTLRQQGHSGPIEDAAQSVLREISSKHGKLTDRESVHVRDVVERVKFQLGAKVADRTDQGEAQDFRREGFMALLDGRFDQAVRAYQQAARSSRDICEPALVEWLTIDAALAAGWVLARGTSSEVDKKVVADLSKRQVELGRQIPDQIQSLDRSRIGNWRNLTKNLRGLAVRVSKDREPSPTPDIMDSSDLDYIERIWASPITAGILAELQGETEWMSGDRAAGAYTLARYGSELLATLVNLEVERPNRALLDDGLLRALTTKGRWRSEWVSRLEGAFEVMSEFRTTDLGQIDEWLESAYADLYAPCERMVRAASVSYVDPLDAFVRTLFARFAYSEPGWLEGQWGKWVARFEAQRGSSRMGCVGGVASLPWGEWLFAKHVAPGFADKAFHDAMILVGTDRNASRDGAVSALLNSFLGTVDDTPPFDRGIPKNGASADIVRQWLANHGFQSEPILHVILTLKLSDGDRAIVADELFTQCMTKYRAAKGNATRINFLLAAAATLSHGGQTDDTELETAAVLEMDVVRKPSGRDGLALPYARMLARVMTDVIQRRGSAGPSLLSSLMECCVANPGGCQFAGDLPFSLLGSHGGPFVDLVGQLLLGQSVARDVDSPIAELAGLHAVSALVDQGDHAAPLPDSWLIGIGHLMVSRQSLVARTASHAAQSVLVLGQVQSSSIERVAPLVQGILVACRDGRAEVAGAAARTLELALGRIQVGPAVREQSVKEVARVTKDTRLGVQRELRRGPPVGNRRRG